MDDDVHNGSSEMLVCINKTALRDIPEDGHLHTHL